MTKTLNLQTPEEDGSMEAYYSMHGRYSTKKNWMWYNIIDKRFDKFRINYDYTNRPKIRKKILLYKKIKQNPKAYLNFGFSLDDYILFLNKQYIMRFEKGIIEYKLNKIKHASKRNKKHKWKNKKKKEQL